MATVAGRIQNFIQSLTPNEAIVADFVEKRPEQVINNSIHAVAKLCDVSVASVSRLATTLGYKDWKELRLTLVRDLNRAEGQGQQFSDIAQKDSDEMVIKKIFNCSMVSLNDTFEQIDKKSVLRVVAAIEKTDRVAFFGTGRSGCFAKEEALRFAHLGAYSDAYSDEYQMLMHSSMLRAGSIAFGFSNSGRSKATVAALAEAQKRKGLTVGIGNYRNTPLEEVSDIYFCTSFPSVGEIATSLTARIALLCIMDSIYVLAATRGRMGTKAEAVDKLIDSGLRISGRGGVSKNKKKR